MSSDRHGPGPGGARALSRRAVLAGGVGALMAPLAPGPVAAYAGRRPGLTSARRMRSELEWMAGLGPRLTGAPAHRRWVDFLDAKLSDLGLRVHRDRQHFTRWEAIRYGLDLLDESGGTTRVPVASYYSYCGRTPRGGVEGELVYLGAVPPPSLPGNPLDVASTTRAVSGVVGEVDEELARRLAEVPGGVAGRIVLMDVVVPPLPFGALEADASFVYDPDGTLGPAADYKRAAFLLATVPHLAAFEAAGAAGVVFAVDASAANARGQYAPFIYPLQDMPSLLVDRDTGARLRHEAARARRARLTLEARVVPRTATDTVHAVLPGRSREVVVVNTHSDGPNAVEENGGIGVLALARHFAAMPRSARTRTLVFVCATGHFAGECTSTNGWVADHQGLVERAVAGLTVEHLGCREWLDNPGTGYRPSGLPEPRLTFHSQTPVLEPAVDAVVAHDVRRTALLRPLGATFLGEGAALHESGVPTIGLVPAPNYLLSFAHHQHLDKVSARQMHAETRWLADLVRRVNTLSATELRAGDSAVLPPQLGGQLPVK